MLHLAVFPVLAWGAARTMQLQMCRRALNYWPWTSEDVPAYFRRTARWCDRVNHSAKAPRWDTALLSSWWRWGGHIARLAHRDESRLLTAILGWRDATYREAIRAMLWKRSDPTRQRLGRHRMGRPINRWEDPIQETCNACAPSFLPWQNHAQDKTAWDAMEITFVQRQVRICSEHAVVPRGRWMIGETPP